MKIIRTDLGSHTIGLTTLGQKEIHLDHDVSQEAEAARLLEFLHDYVLKTERRIIAEETLAYGYWLLKFKDSGGFLALCEFEPAGALWVPGAAKAIEYRSIQEGYCAACGSEFCPPVCSTLAAVSDGVLEGKPVEGVRYRAPGNISGWYFTTSSYSGNVESLTTEHLFHITSRRPDLIKYIALAPGYYFDQALSEDAYYSGAVADEEP